MQTIEHENPLDVCLQNWVGAKWPVATLALAVERIKHYWFKVMYINKINDSTRSNFSGSKVFIEDDSEGSGAISSAHTFSFLTDSSSLP